MDVRHALKVVVLAAATLMAAGPAGAQPAVRWLIIVDDLHVDFRNTGHLRALLKTIAAELIRDGDQVALHSTGPSSVSVAWTYDRSVVDSVVKKIAGSGNAIVSTDSRYQLPRFSGVTAATPNEAELEQLTGVPVDDERAVEKAGRHLLERLDARILLITRGSRGMALLERDGATTFIPIHGTDEIADVTGAGDTVISTFTLALAAGATPIEAASLANVAGGVVVMKRGTGTVSRAELRQALGLDA